MDAILDAAEAMGKYSPENTQEARDAVATATSPAGTAVAIAIQGDVSAGAAAAIVSDLASTAKNPQKLLKSPAEVASTEKAAVDAPSAFSRLANFFRKPPPPKPPEVKKTAD